MEALLTRPAVVALAVVGAVLSGAAALAQARGWLGARMARLLNLAGYAVMTASMLLFALAGLRGGA